MDIYHTKQPCPKCTHRLDKIRYPKPVRERTGVTYRMLCPSCGWADRPDPTVTRRPPGQSTRTVPSLRFQARWGAPKEAIEDMARYAHANYEVHEDDDNTIITLWPRTRWHNTQIIIERAASFGWELAES